MEERIKHEIQPGRGPQMDAMRTRQGEKMVGSMKRVVDSAQARALGWNVVFHLLIDGFMYILRSVELFFRLKTDVPLFV